VDEEGGGWWKGKRKRKRKAACQWQKSKMASSAGVATPFNSRSVFAANGETQTD